MTNEEALSILHCPDAYGGIYSEKYGRALGVAFKSLEAWEKVKAEIDQYLFQNEFGLEYRKEVSQIIDKYKAESEEEECGK